MENIDIGLKAMEGDEDAVRMYCGSYTLVKSSNGNLYRCKGDIPKGYTKVECVYDIDGFLYARFWALPRIG